MANIQGLNTEQINWLNQSAPGMGTRGSTDPNRLNFGDMVNALFNLGGNVVTYTTNATANTVDAVPHGLPYVPRGYFSINNGNGGVLYTGAVADTTNLHLKCTTASNAVTLIVF